MTKAMQGTVLLQSHLTGFYGTYRKRKGTSLSPRNNGTCERLHSLHCGRYAQEYGFPASP